VKRREFITLLGGAAAAWPLAARAQQSAMPVVGFLRQGSRDQFPHLTEAFRQGLREMGYVEQQNVLIEYRWAEGRNDRAPALLTDLIQRRVAVIAVPGSTAAALAAKTAVQTIPVVFGIGGDPVEFGLVSSLARPGGNITGIAQLIATTSTKRLDLLRQLAPRTRKVGLLVNPTNPLGEAERRETQAAAQTLGLELCIVNVTSKDEIDDAFPSLLTQGADALLLGGDAFFFNQQVQIAILSASHKMPAISQFREYVTAGGLMSYGSNLAETYRLTGIYVGRILRGDRPDDLPVIQPTKFDFMINLRTAKALGLEIPATLLALADEVIE
jgi:putative tryptophan/tyrosine transport system substrate-binding protein